MPPPKRMTANPARPVARHRAGKPTVQERESSSEEESDDDDQPAQSSAPAPRPTASSFAPKTGSISSNLKQVDLNAGRKPPQAADTEINEDEFETEESEAGSGSDGSESEEDESSEEEESSSEDEKPVRARPVFVKKGQRDTANGGGNDAGPPKKSEDELWAGEQLRKREKADALIQEELEKQAQLKAAGKKYWDDEDNIEDNVDDADDLDPEAEHAAWKLREIKRLKRDQDAIVTAEREREEVERRRNLSKEEREAEDRVFLDAQKAAKEGRGQMSFRQKYIHKGAFFTDDLGELGKRDIMAGRYEDDFRMKEALPEYLQKRDITKIGKKGGTRYKDMRSEDTGRWGDFLDKKGPPRRDGGDNFQSNDDRFRPDCDGGGGREGPSGANASVLGDRKRPPPDGERGEDKRARVS
jgi:microfibrillar-associated protein 1